MTARAISRRSRFAIAIGCYAVSAFFASGMFAETSLATQFVLAVCMSVALQVLLYGVIRAVVDLITASLDDVAANKSQVPQP